jgi:ABC-2 type transport system permease protein
MSEAVAETHVTPTETIAPREKQSGGPGEALRHIWTIAKREISGYFASPVAYVFIVIFLLLSGFLTFMVAGFFERGQANLLPFFAWHPWLYLFLVPAVGMRMWSEERRLGTIELLLTMPITPWQAILGKFLASWLVLALSLALTFPIVLTVNYLGNPDNGVIFASYIGSLLLSGTYLSISAMTSAVTRNQVVSFILSLVICLFLILAGWPPVTDLLTQWASTGVVETIAGFSVMTHFDSIQKGVIDLRDVVFFLSVIVFSLFTTSVILRAHRAG